MRDLHPEFEAIIQTQELSRAYLCFLDFEEEPLYAWSGLGMLHYGGFNWYGFGALWEMSGIEEYSDIRAGQFRISATHVPNVALSGVHELTFKGRAVEFSIALFDESDQIVAVQTLVRGTMETLVIKRRPQGSRIEVGVTNELARLKKSWGYNLTDAHQRELHPGDTGLQYVASLQDLTISF